MSESMFIFVEDAGHGWMQVLLSEIRILGIADKISSYSYHDKKSNFVYLEEDCDAPLFAEEHLKQFGSKVQLKINHVGDEWIGRTKYSRYNSAFI